LNLPNLTTTAIITITMTAVTATIIMAPHDHEWGRRDPAQARLLGIGSPVAKSSPVPTTLVPSSFATCKLVSWLHIGTTRRA